MRVQNHSTWNHLLKECASRNQWREILSHHHQIKTAGLPIAADPDLFPPILKACATLRRPRLGASVHADAIKTGTVSHPSVANSVLSLYIKCDAVSSAASVLDSMANRTSVSWNAMIHGFLDRGDHYEGLQVFARARVSGFEPNVSTLVLLIRAEGLKIHAYVIRGGFSGVLPVRNSLLRMYADRDDVTSARVLFDEMSDRDVITWSTMIGGLTRCGEARDALDLFREMVSSVEEIEIDGPAIVSVVKACGVAGDVNWGRSAHGLVVRGGFESDAFVASSLVDMYSKCGELESARGVARRDTVSWNSMVSGLVWNGRYSEALDCFHSMTGAGFVADEATLVSLLQSCKSLGHASHCKCIHSVAIRRRYDENATVSDALMDAYSKCGLVEPAWSLFDRADRKSQASWSTMIACLASHGRPDDAVMLFADMRRSGARPNSVTMLSLLDACSVSAELERSKCAHAIAVRCGLASDVSVGTAILDAYGKCGDSSASERVFVGLRERSAITWSAMIAAYGINGRPMDALALLREMEEPNGVTVLSALSACDHGGAVEEGLACFQGMSGARAEHYACVADMLGRAGDLAGSRRVIDGMPRGVGARASAWSSLLSACRGGADSDLAREAAARVIESEPRNSAGYVLGSHVYGLSGFQRESALMRSALRENGLRVVGGFSSIYVGHKARKFVSGNGAHAGCKEMYGVVERLHALMKRNAGFVHGK